MTLTITGKKDHFAENQVDGDMYVRFDRRGDDWQVEIMAQDGGFIEVDPDDDLALLAPEDGYQNKLIFSGDKLGSRPEKKIFFKSNKPQLFSVIDVRVAPRVKHDKAVVTIKYVINQEGGRSLVTPKRK